MASNSTSRKKSKKDAEEVITLGSSDEEEHENVKEGKKSETPSILEEFHDNVFAVARTFRFPFTPQQFSNKYKQLNYFDLPMKPFGYSSVREVLSATRDIFHEEDGTFFVYKWKKVPTTLEEFHESILAVAQSFRSSFTLNDFSVAYSQMFRFCIPWKEFGYSCAREALFSVKGIRVEEDGDFIFVEGSLSEEEFKVRQTRLKELQKKISEIFKALPEPFSATDVSKSYQRTYKGQNIPYMKVGFDKFATFLSKHPDLEEVPGTQPLFKMKNGNTALKELQDKVSAVARTLPEPFSRTAITDHYYWRYNEFHIPFESFGYKTLADFCRRHPELEEVQGKCGDLFFKMKNDQKKESSALTEEERAVSKVSKRKHQEVLEEDLQPAERDSYEDLPKKKRKDKEMEREQKEDEDSQNDHDEKQSKAHKTDKVVSKKKHKKQKTVSGEESVETGRSEVAVDLQTTKGGEDPPKKKKKSKKRDEGGNGNENDNRQNDHVEEQSKAIKTEKSSSKKKEKVASVRENVEIKGNDCAEGHAVAATDSNEVIDVKPEKKEIGVNETTKNVNENIVTTEAQDPMLMTAPFPHQMPPMPMHF